MSKEKVTIIGMPPGIGDLHWIMTKMESFKKKNGIEKIKVLMNLGYDSGNKSTHHYSIYYFDLLPFIDSAESILEELPFEYSMRGGSGTSLFKDRAGCNYLIEFNSSLENCMKLNDILPEYETNFDYPILEPESSKKFADRVRRAVGGKLVLIFTSNWPGNEVWVQDLWRPVDWMTLASKIYNETSCKPVLIGAQHDNTYAERLLPLDKNKIIANLIGATSIAQLFALIREADVLIAYQCGVAMMATKFKTPVVALWPIKNKANPHGSFKRCFMRSWLPPRAIENGYIPIAWGDKRATPDGIFSAIRRFL